MADVIEVALARKYRTHWDNHFEIYEVESWRWNDDHKLVYGINWAAIGTATTEETVKFANGLLEVSKIVDRINSLELVVDREMTDNLDTKEAFNNAVESFTALYLEG